MQLPLFAPVPEGQVLLCHLVYFGPYRGLIRSEQVEQAKAAGRRVYLGTGPDDRQVAYALLGTLEGGGGASGRVVVSFEPNMDHGPTCDVLRSGSECRLLGMAAQSIEGEQPSSTVCSLLTSIAVQRALGYVTFDEADAAAMQG
jgi:hypothetical protein